LRGSQAYASDDESDEMVGARPEPTWPEGGGLVLVGTADGIVEEIDAHASDASAWRVVRIIVEVKNRMRHASSARPIALHDEIQMLV
jgi:hypothetical protein